MGHLKFFIWWLVVIVDYLGQSRSRRLPRADILWTRGGFQMWTSAHFVAKSFGFWNLWCVRMGKGGEPLWNFADKGKEVNFSWFCVDVFYGLPLTLLEKKYDFIFWYGCRINKLYFFSTTWRILLTSPSSCSKLLYSNYVSSWATVSNLY